LLRPRVAEIAEKHRLLVFPRRINGSGDTQR
jgi:hypothetical protein